MTNRNPPGKLARLFEHLLLLTGITGIGAWLGFLAVGYFGQSWDHYAFERLSTGQSATITGYFRNLWTPQRRRPEPPQPILDPIQPESTKPSVPSVPETNSLIGRLAIPRLKLTTTVREGTTDGTLALAAGHIPGTALPGENGNVAVAGHRDTFFRGLSGIKSQDLIEFETLNAKFHYQVTSTTIVKPAEGHVLKGGLYPELTLVTCYPFDYVGAAPDRFIVKARLISQNPLHAKPSPAPEPPKAETPRPPVKKEVSASAGRIPFEIPRSRSRQIAPGISLGVTAIDLSSRRVSGWLWIMPERRTIWLRNHPALQPLFFRQDGKSRELRIASVTPTTASGYLLLKP